MDKLVRDRIPEIIERKGEDVPPYRTLSVDSCLKVHPEFKVYRRALLDKLLEEVQEVHAAQMFDLDTNNHPSVVSELADIQEVLDAIYAEFQIKPEDVTQRQREKRNARGAFSRRIIMSFPDK